MSQIKLVISFVCTCIPYVHYLLCFNSVGSTYGRYIYEMKPGEEGSVLYQAVLTSCTFRSTRAFSKTEPKFYL